MEGNRPRYWPSELVETARDPEVNINGPKPSAEYINHSQYSPPPNRIPLGPCWSKNELGLIIWGVMLPFAALQQENAWWTCKWICTNSP